MYGYYSIIQATWLNSSVMPPEDVDKMANSVDPDKTAPGLKEQSLMGLHCLSLFVQKFYEIPVENSQQRNKMAS